VHAHLRDREHDQRDGNGRLPDQVGAGDEERRRREQQRECEADDVADDARADAMLLFLARREIVPGRNMGLIAHAPPPSK
jgi:hypothetical protein